MAPAADRAMMELELARSLSPLRAYASPGGRWPTLGRRESCFRRPLAEEAIGSNASNGDLMNVQPLPSDRFKLSGAARVAAPNGSGRPRAVLRERLPHINITSPIRQCGFAQTLRSRLTTPEASPLLPQQTERPRLRWRGYAAKGSSYRLAYHHCARAEANQDVFERHVVGAAILSLSDD